MKPETESCWWDLDTNSPFKLIQIPLAVLMISINEIFLPVTSNAEPAMRLATEAAQLLSLSVTYIPQKGFLSCLEALLNRQQLLQSYPDQ